MILQEFPFSIGFYWGFIYHITNFLNRTGRGDKIFSFLSHKVMSRFGPGHLHNHRESSDEFINQFLFHTFHFCKSLIEGRVSLYTSYRIFLTFTRRKSAKEEPLATEINKRLDRVTRIYILAKIRVTKGLPEDTSTFFLYARSPLYNNYFAMGVSQLVRFLLVHSEMINHQTTLSQVYY